MTDSGHDDGATIIEIGQASPAGSKAYGVEVVYGSDETHELEATVEEPEDEYSVDDAPPMGMTQKVVLVFVALLVAFGIGYLIWFWGN